MALQAHDVLGHLLWRVRRTGRALEVRMRSHCRAHVRHLLVLGLLGARWMHHVSSFTQLLQILLQTQFGIRQLMLGRWWCAVLVRVLAWPSAHLRVGIRVASHVEARRTENGNQVVQL